MTIAVDRQSLLVDVGGDARLGAVERELAKDSLTLGLSRHDHDELGIDEWIARGAPGAPSPFADPCDHLIAGLSMRLTNGQRVDIRPCPRRAVGPDLVALVFGMSGRFARVERAWLRVHAMGKVARFTPLPVFNDASPVSDAENALFEAIGRELERGRANGD